MATASAHAHRFEALRLGTALVLMRALQRLMTAFALARVLLAASLLALRPAAMQAFSLFVAAAILMPMFA